MSKKLYRSETNKVLGGVCGGLGEYLGIDPVFVRLFFVFLTFAEGIAVLIYVAFWIFVPQDRMKEDLEFSDRVQSMGDDVRQSVREPHPQAGLIIGLALIILGAVSLLDNLNIEWLEWLDYGIVWPLLLIAAGIIWIFRGMQRGSDAQ
jgi:phage shock protein PspC (stress-responsive transcriptional regulator)